VAFPKKGTRRLVVDGRPYLWRVRRKPTYWQECFSSPMRLAVRADGGTGGTLVLVLSGLRPDHAWRPGLIVTPAAVAGWVQAALAAGWAPWSGGGAFEYRPPADAEPGAVADCGGVSGFPGSAPQ
jgi:hypothetical protein